MRVLISAKNQAYSFDCLPGEPILYAGLRAGVELPYECGTGTCGTCRARRQQGELATHWAEAPGHAGLKRSQGDILMCQTAAVADCRLEVANIVKPMPPSACLPEHRTAIVRSRRALTPDVVTFDIDLDCSLDFEAGQFVVLEAPGVAGGRAYSMVNYGRGVSRLTFVVKKKPGGRLSEWLFDGQVEGITVRLFGPLGRATFHPELGRHVLVIAGGSGIAGMMSILSRACEDRYFERYLGWVFFGLRTHRDAFFLDELSAFRQRAGRRLRVMIALSDEDVDNSTAAAHPDLEFARGLVHAVAAQEMKGTFQNVRAYAAGPPPMVDATLRMLLLEGKLTADNIRYDKFS